MNKKDKSLLIRLVNEHLSLHEDNIARVGQNELTTNEDDRLNYRNLQKMGYVRSNNGSQFRLEAEGYLKGKELKHPVQAFLLVHWKWLIATIVVGVVTPIVLAILAKP